MVFSSLMGLGQMGGDGGGGDGGGGELDGHQLYSTGFQQAYWPGASPVVR